MRQNIYRNITLESRKLFSFSTIFVRMSLNFHRSWFALNCRRYLRVEESAQRIFLANRVFSDLVTFHPSSILHHETKKEDGESNLPASKTEHWLLGILSISANTTEMKL